MTEYPISRAPLYPDADITHRCGFEVVGQFGGHSITVGDRTQAMHRLANVPLARTGLASALPIIQ